MCFGSHNPYTFWFSMKSLNTYIEINRKVFNSEQTPHWDSSLLWTMQTQGGRNQDSIVLRNKEVFACCSCLSTTVILTSTSCYGNVFPSSPLPICWHHCSLSPLSPSFSLVWPSDWMQQCSLRGVTIYIEEVVKTPCTTSTDRHDCL